MKRTRTTISLTEEQFETVKGKADKKGQSVSRFLIEAALRDDRLLEYKKVRQDSLKEVFDALIQGTLSPTEIPNLPRELREAISDFQSAARRVAGDYEQAHHRDDFLLSELPYPNEKTLPYQRKLAKLFKELDEVGVVSAKVGEPIAEKPRTDSKKANDGQLKQTEGAAAHLVRPGLIRRRRVAYLYPFYLPPSRRSSWGIIKYGSHTRIGVLIRKETFSAQLEEWQDVLDPKSTITTNRGKVWFSEIISILVGNAQLARAAGRPLAGIAFREGFLEEEISEVIWSHAQSNVEYDYELLRQPQPFFATSDMAEYLLNNKVARRADVFVADLCDCRVIEDRIREHWALVPFPHGVSIPVGIGFTLSFLPRLLAHGNWKKIQAFFDAEKTHIESALENCGIEFPNQGES